MKPEHIIKMKDKLEVSLGRDAKSNEISNMETDALLLSRFCLDKIEELEIRLKKLEK